MAGNDDSEFFDPMRAFDRPLDPLDQQFASPAPGVAPLVAARDLLRAGKPAAASEAASDARRIGIPAELVPGARAIECGALLGVGQPGRALEVPREAWAAHPDVAILPALIGVAQHRLGDCAGAARTFHAALASDDPDHSLAIHRWLLSRLLNHRT